MLVALPLLALLLWWAVYRGMAPLRTLGRTLTARAPHATHPVELDQAPAEMLPMLDALNDLLRRIELGFLDAGDPRFAATVRAVEQDLRRGDFIFRYVETDDFGEPENAFIVCTFWYVNALAALDRRPEARELFEKLLACCNRHGLLAEHIDLRSGE